jgi:hypothetical protein
MGLAAILLLLTGGYPLKWAWLARRRTALAHAVVWANLAWMAWVYVVLCLVVGDVAKEVRYVALCLTACAGVAVLGARRPGVGAWNFVVLGLLVVLLLPLAEGLRQLQLSLPRLVFLAGSLGVGFLNYLPTRLWPAAVFMAVGCGLELWSLTDQQRIWDLLALGAAPWAAFVMVRTGSRTASEFDRTWRHFRDSYGALWAQRTREQFNRAAANAGLTGRLGWFGLRGAGTDEQEQLLDILKLALKRFGPPE